MSSASGDWETTVAKAAATLESVRPELMACAGVCGSYVGLLRDADGMLTEAVGIVVIVDPAASPERERALPEVVGEFPVQIIYGTPTPSSD